MRQNLVYYFFKFFNNNIHHTCNTDYVPGVEIKKTTQKRFRIKENTIIVILSTTHKWGLNTLSK